MADLYTRRDAAERLGISYPTIKQWLYRGKLRAVKTLGKRIVFSGDTNGEGLAKNADIFVTHHAIPEDATGLERRLHMRPSVIGATAAKAHVKAIGTTNQELLRRFYIRVFVARGHNRPAAIRIFAKHQALGL